jgi:hypothetical protein
VPQRKGCARCKMFDAIGVDGQEFRCGDLVFNVAQARALVEASKREPIEVPPGKAYEALLDTGISLQHTYHVDIKFPSIVVRRKGQWIFIDGNHRAFRRLCRRLPVKAYLLTPRETRVILKSK